jgi:hypothetical protein
MLVNLLRPLLLCKFLLADGSGESAGLGCAGAYSKAVSSGFVRGKGVSGIAVSSAGKVLNLLRQNGGRKGDRGKWGIYRKGGWDGGSATTWSHLQEENVR